MHVARALTDYLVDENDDEKKENEENESDSELKQSLNAFKKNYTLFATKNQLVLVDEYVQEAFVEAETDQNIQKAATVF